MRKYKDKCIKSELSLLGRPDASCATGYTCAPPSRSSASLWRALETSKSQLVLYTTIIDMIAAQNSAMESPIQSPLSPRWVQNAKATPVGKP